MIQAAAEPLVKPLPAPPRLDHLSWSGISLYRTCAKRFRLHYVEKAEEERVSSSLPFGSGIHRAVELAAEARLLGRALPSVEEMLSAYESAWQDAKARGVGFQHSEGEDEGSLRELASRMLAAYRAFAANERGKVVAIEHEERLAIAGVPVEARLDLVELRDDGALVVTDVKSSRCRWGETKVRENLPQLVIYAHAALPMMLELGAKRIAPRFVVITKSKNPVVQVIEPEATRDDVRRLRELLCATWSAVAKEAFPPREGWQCAACPFRERCRGGQS
jgi:CRISPR/Cas system-associated exonuclease Cas4 (RecB family)